MKIKIVETYVEASAEDLRQSNRIADNFCMMLNRCFSGMAFRTYGDTEAEEEQEEEQDETC